MLIMELNVIFYNECSGHFKKEALDQQKQWV